MDRDYSTIQFKELVAAAQQIYELYHKVANDPSHSIVKSTLMMIELFHSFDKYQESANALVKIANVFADRMVLKPLLYEQASYDYLMMQQYRKAVFYMHLAGQFYEKQGLKFHASNCYNIVHPFFQAKKGWNEIRYKLYTSLSELSKETCVNQELAV